MITSRQRHKDLMEYSIIDCADLVKKHGIALAITGEMIVAMYDKKCAEETTKVIHQNQIALEQLRHENYKKMEKIRRTAMEFKPYDATPKNYK